MWKEIFEDREVNPRTKLMRKRRRRAFRVRNKQGMRGSMLRISVFRSLRQIYAQIIDDSKGETVASFSSVQLKDKSGSKREIARRVGLELGKIAVEAGLSGFFFDRGRFLYHGRVKALADGMREAGLQF